MAVGDINRLEFFTHANQRQFINVLHYRETVDDTGDPTLQGLTDAWSTAFVAGLAAVYAGELTFGCVKGNQIVSAGLRKLPGVTYFENLTGGEPDPPLPGNTVGRINFYGQNHGRTIRGGLNLGGLPRVREVNNGPNSIMEANIENAWLNKLPVDIVGGAPSTGEWEFVFMSRAALNPLDPPVAWPGVPVKPTEYTLSPFFSTLRSRQGTYTNIQT